MGLMTKMRDQTGVVLWILVFAFGIIFMLQDTDVFSVIGTTGTEIINVNGDGIQFDEYNQAVDQQMRVYQNSFDGDVPPQQMDAIRDRVYQSMVDDRIRQQQMDRLGIAVTDDELFDMVAGQNPDPLITAYFPGDGPGGVDRALLQNFIDNPEAQQDWIQIEEYLRSKRRSEKLDGLITATVRISDAEVEEEYRRRNHSVDTRFVALRYAAIPDAEVDVTDSDLRSYYNDHRDEFERQKSFTLDYVSITREPSADDTLAILSDMANLKDRFVSADNDSLFLARYASARPYSGAFFRRDELDEELADVIFENPEAGTVIGPVLASGQAHMVKVLEVRPAEEIAVRARHILFSAPEEGDAAARREARSNAQNALRQLRNGDADFATLAAETNTDATASTGGDLGWFGPGKMVEPFQDAAFGARIGRIVGPVATQFGYHLIEVTDRAEVDVRIADYAQRIRPSVDTELAAQELLEDIQFYAEESGDFYGEVERNQLATQQVLAELEQTFIPGIGRSRALMNFLATADEGDISPVVELDNSFIVAYVADVQSAGYRSLDEVRAQLEPRVRLEKKREIQVAKLEEAIASNDFSGLAGAVQEVERTANGITFSNLTVPGLGREPTFVGTALGLDVDEVSGVVEGENAAFVISVVNVVEPPEITDAQRNQIRTELLNRKRNQVRNQWIAGLRDEADVSDYRRRFLQ